MNPNIYISRDSTSLESGKFKAYYGHECIDEKTGEWLCIIWKNNKEVGRYTNSQLLEHSCGESPEAMLLSGLAMYLGKL